LALTSTGTRSRWGCCTRGTVSGLLKACYEAGPTGYDLCRLLRQVGVACEVIAPSLIPKASGDKVKTDKSNCQRLARLHRAGFVGLVPTERSSGGREHRGHLTKAGNAHLRARLVEAAWSYQHRPYVGRVIAKRHEGLPPRWSPGPGPRNYACAGASSTWPSARTTSPSWPPPSPES
jgi:transposase